jgi:hypothetical protein
VEASYFSQEGAAGLQPFSPMERTSSLLMFALVLFAMSWLAAGCGSGYRDYRNSMQYQGYPYQGSQGYYQPYPGQTYPAYQGQTGYYYQGQQGYQSYPAQPLPVNNQPASSGNYPWTRTPVVENPVAQPAPQPAPVTNCVPAKDHATAERIILETARAVKNSNPQFFRQDVTRADAYAMMTAVINPLRSQGIDAARVLNHPSLPMNNPGRWGSDALVLRIANGYFVYDVYASWPFGDAQLLNHGPTEPSRYDATGDLAPLPLICP